ncbi:hypothetical protein DFH29DRAFT_932156 [Suillus ampliporus]|nr:hypothetical protein DFH29DRAFT_932156 [Suillus ampliporus]
MLIFGARSVPIMSGQDMNLRPTLVDARIVHTRLNGTLPETYAIVLIVLDNSRLPCHVASTLRSSSQNKNPHGLAYKSGSSMGSKIRLTRPLAVCLLPSCKHLPSPTAIFIMPAPVITYYDVEVVQFWRGRDEGRLNNPLHWAIYVPTGGGIGNTYHLWGDTDTYTLHFRRQQPHEDPSAWRGSYKVGRVAAHRLNQFERDLARVCIMWDNPRWDSQSWVWDALRHVRHKGFDISWEVQLGILQVQMCSLVEDWEYNRINL